MCENINMYYAGKVTIVFMRNSWCSLIIQASRSSMSGRPIYFAAELSFFILFFLPELIDENRPISRQPLLHQQWAPGSAHKISTDIWPLLPPFLRWAKCAKFWPKFWFDPSHLRTTVFFLPSYQTWGGWVPPTPRTVGTVGTPKGRSGKFLIYPPFQRPTPSTAPPMLYHLLGP